RFACKISHRIDAIQRCRSDWTSLRIPLQNLGDREPWRLSARTRHSNNGVPIIRQPAAQASSNQACCSSYQYLHSKLPNSSEQNAKSLAASDRLSRLCPDSLPLTPVAMNLFVLI